MTEAQKILSLIEAVDPPDTAGMDAIDGCVFRYLYLRPGMAVATPAHPKYTRSRDALKKIRPEGWDYACSYTDGGWAELWKKDNSWRCVAKKLPNAELAELHAIIQAIDQERSQK